MTTLGIPLFVAKIGFKMDIQYFDEVVQMLPQSIFEAQIGKISSVFIELLPFLNPSNSVLYYIG